MGTLFLHEFGHAMTNATYCKLSFDDYKKKGRLEPFSRDDRMPEVGHALIQFILDGAPFPTGHRGEIRCLYGLHMRPFPGAHFEMERFVGHESGRQTPWEAGIRNEARYAVRMDYVQKMFTAEFWQNKALRSDPDSVFKYQREGLAAYRPLEDPADSPGIVRRLVGLDRIWRTSGIRHYCCHSCARMVHTSAPNSLPILFL